MVPLRFVRRTASTQQATPRSPHSLGMPLQRPTFSGTRARRVRRQVPVFVLVVLVAVLAVVIYALVVVTYFMVVSQKPVLFITPCIIAAIGLGVVLL